MIKSKTFESVPLYTFRNLKFDSGREISNLMFSASGKAKMSIYTKDYVHSFFVDGTTVLVPFILNECTVEVLNRDTQPQDIYVSWEEMVKEVSVSSEYKYGR